MSDDDLDELLGEALDELDEMGKKNDEKARKMEQVVDQEVKNAEMTGDLQGQMQALLQSLVQSLGGEGDDNFNLEGFTGFMDQLSSTCDLDDKEKNQLDAVKQLLASIENDVLDEETMKKALNMLPDELKHVDNDFTKMAQQMAQHEGQVEPSSEAAVSQLLTSTFQDPEILRLIELMRDCFPSWIGAHGDLPQAEQERHMKQYNLCCRICSLLKESQTESSKYTEVMEAFSEMADLGELPTDLDQYTPILTASDN